MGDGALRRIAFAIAIVASFGAGAVASTTGVFGIHLAIQRGGGYVGDEVATIEAGGTSYGVRKSIAWRDESGSEHAGGWPECLPPGQVTNVRFEGAIVWHEDVGMGTVLWVDCSGG